MPKVSKEPDVQLTAADLQVGNWYRGKRSVNSRTDRRIVYIDGTFVRYCSRNIRVSHTASMITISAFLQWVYRRVTEMELADYTQRYVRAKTELQSVVPASLASPAGGSGTTHEFDVALL